MELKYTSRGPRLIEINARMGGGQVRKTHLEVYGVDLVEETLFSCVGIPNRPPADLSRPLCALAYNYVNAPQSGRVESLAALAQLRRLPGVVYAKGLVKVRPQRHHCTSTSDVLQYMRFYKMLSYLR